MTQTMGLGKLPEDADGLGVLFAPVELDGWPISKS